MGKEVEDYLVHWARETGFIGKRDPSWGFFVLVVELDGSFSRFHRAAEGELNQSHVLLNGSYLKREKCSFLPYKHRGVVTERMRPGVND